MGGNRQGWCSLPGWGGRTTRGDLTPPLGVAKSHGRGNQGRWLSSGSHRGGGVAWGHEEYPGWAHLPLTRLVQPETDIHPTGCMPGDTCRWKIGCIGLHSLLTIIRPERGNLPCDLGFMDQL